MKTSVNIPDWLHDQVRELAPDVPFGEQVRDALLIALPTWRGESRESAMRRALKAQLRDIEARYENQRTRDLATARAKREARPAARAKRAPATAPAGRPAPVKRSAAKAAGKSAPPASPRRKRA